jgi:hypothetical protein
MACQSSLLEFCTCVKLRTPFQSVVMVIKSQVIKQGGHLAHMGEMRNAYINLIGNIKKEKT